MTDHASIDGSPPVSGGPVKPSQGTVRFRSTGGDQAATQDRLDTSPFEEPRYEYVEKGLGFVDRWHERREMRRATDPDATTPLRSLKPTERCIINGHVCEVERQARRTTFVRIVESRDIDIVGARVQLDREQEVRRV